MVWRLKLPHNRAWLLMALADHAHDDGGRCFPGVQHLAWKTGYGERQVRRVLHDLREDGLIEAVAYAHGGTRPTEYHLHLDRGVMKPFIRSWGGDDKMSGPPLRGVTSLGTEGDDIKSATPGVTVRPPDTAKTSEPSVTIIEPSGEPSVYKGSWRRTLRAIEGWGEKGEPHMEALHMWIEEKGWLKDQLEASAIGLAATSEKTLKGYRNMVAAFQRRLNEGYDRIPADRRGPDGHQGDAASGRADGWDSNPA